MATISNISIDQDANFSTTVTINDSSIINMTLGIEAGSQFEVKIERGTEVSPWKYIHKTIIAPS